MGSDEVLTRQQEQTLQHDEASSLKIMQSMQSHQFTTPYKMRKFSEDTVDSSSREFMSSLPSTVVGKSNMSSSSLPPATLSSPYASPLSCNTSGGTVTPSLPSISKSQQQEQQQQGIPIPAFMQPLLGLEFVPFVMPMVDEAAMSIFGEALTDKLLEELDVVGCPYGSSSNSSTNPVPQPVSPLPAPTMTTGKKLDTSPAMSKLQLTDLKDVVANVEERPAKHAVDDETPPDHDIEVVSQAASSSWAPSSIRRRNVFHRRRTRSFGVDNHSHQEENGKPPPHSGTPRRQIGLRFMKKNNRSKGREISTQYPKSTSMASLSSLECLEQQQELLQTHQLTLQAVQEEAAAMRQTSQEIELRVQSLQREIAQLQGALKEKHEQLQSEVNKLDRAQVDMQRLQQAALEASQAVTKSLQQMTVSMESTTDVQLASLPPRPRAATAPIDSDVYMDENNVRLDWYDGSNNEEGASSTASTSSIRSSTLTLNLDTLPSPNEFVFVDHNLKYILKNLDRLGYDVATDESDRFVPTRETEKALQRYQQNNTNLSFEEDWPIQPWHCAHDDDILIWTGDVRHDGLGSDWPVCKARGLINTNPRTLLEYVMDSSKVKEYNKMSQGREDLYFIQKGLDTLAVDSSYGIAGECKIVKAVNKPRLLPITIEMISLMHCKPIDNIPGSYMMVYRSVFEDTSVSGDVAPVIRSEMLLGVVLVRPYNKDHSITEMTSITHMYSPGVPEMIARRAAPSSAMNMLRDLQSIFK
jgi:hypothetical protein